MNAGYSNNKPESELNVGEIMELGIIFRSIILDLKTKNDEYEASRFNRTQWHVRKNAAESLRTVIDGVRYGFRIMTCNQENDKNSVINKSKEFEILSSVLVLFFELRELQRGKLSPLLAHDIKAVGFGAYHFINRYIQAGGAAAVQALMETEMSQDAAARLVAEALEKSGFGPRGRPYTPAAIEDWFRHRKNKKHFEAPYEEWCTRFRHISGAAAGPPGSSDLGIKSDLRDAIIQLLVSLTNIFSYRITARP